MGIEMGGGNKEDNGVEVNLVVPITNCLMEA